MTDPSPRVCPRCGQEAGGETLCRSCGLARHSSKEPALAILFSLLFAGAGELYVGDSGAKTITLLVLATIAWFCAFTVVLLPVSLVLVPAFIYSGINSARLVRAHNARSDPS
ncbi:MAG: hypothetical protein ACLQBB_13500 [Solirubrobacteraceae bacterium]